MFRFRLLQGKHIERNPEGKMVTYNEGDIFVTKSDLRSFNPAGMSPKFLFISDANAPELPEGATVCPMCHRPMDTAGRPAPAEVQATPVKLMPHTGPDQSTATLQAMSDEELKSLAAEEEVELDEFDARETIIAKIQAATLV